MRILIIGVTFFLASCGPTSIDDIKKHRLSFDALPDTVKSIYETEAKKSKTDFEYIVISTNKSISFDHKHTGMDNGIWTLMTEGFNHHFYINGRHFTLQANQGNPFVLHDNHLYYTLELNLAHYNYKNAVYIAVNLQK